MRVRANESERGQGASDESGEWRVESGERGARSKEQMKRERGVRIERGDRDGQRSNTRCSALYINLILFDL